MKRILILTIAVLLGCFSASAQKVSVGVNAFDIANFGAVNGEMGISLAQRISLNFGGRYCNWGYGPEDAGIQNRKRTAWLGVRFWPWYVNSGWYIQAKGQYNEINSNILTGVYTNPLTGVTSKKKIEGDAFGGGLAFGYDVILGKHWNLEFGLGAWAGIWTDLNTYTRRIGGYAVPDECYVNKFFFLPDDVAITVRFIF